MATVAKPFSDDQKSEIYKRDRATCCFSGANLWLLDSPLRHGWESDWADHIRPKSRGGGSDIGNGACASATYNVKKRNNSADTTYLFRNGHPTPIYYELFGPPPTSVIERLQRLANLEQPDWYFNRAINWVLQALDYKCWSSEWDERPVRDDKYWFNAAYKKIVKFQDIAGSFSSIEQRGLIVSPNAQQKVLLSMRQSDSLTSFTKFALELLPTFKINSRAWYEYFHPEDYVDSIDLHDSHRLKAYEKAKKVQGKLTIDTFQCIDSDYKIRFVPA